MKRQTRGIVVWLALVLLMVVGFSYMAQQMQNGNDYSYQALKEDLKKDRIKQAVIHQNTQVPTGQLVVLLEDGRQLDMYVDDVNEIRSMLDENDVEFQITNVPQENKVFSTVLSVATLGVLVFMVVMMFRGSSGGSGGKMMNFGKSRARMSTEEDKKINFNNVAGLQEEKEDLREIVDFLKSPGKYNKVGARIPKGVLLVEIGRASCRERV